MGVLFGAGMICQIAGLRYILPSVSSFLTSLTVVFTPLAQALILRLRRVGMRTWAGVALALTGMGILSLPNPGACAECHPLPAPPFPFMGEIATTLGALFFTVQVLALDRYSPRCNPARMSLAMLSGSAIFTTIVGVLFCGSGLYRADVLSGLVTDAAFVLRLASLVIFCSVLAIQLMIRYQQFVSPAVASVIYSTESVFATLFSLFFATEIMTGKTAIGGVLILSALILVTMPAKEPVVAAEA